MSSILYTYKGGVYLNITNQCPCNCTFCIRSEGEGLGSAESLWLDKDPSLNEIFKAIDEFDFTGYDEIIFCGYGEPTCAFDNLIETCKYIRKHCPDLKLRLNTNGLSNLINEMPTAKSICENIHSISISLNAPDAEKYNDITRPSFGKDAFYAMLDFARECKKYTDNVVLSVVDVISQEDITLSQKVADELGIRFRVRIFGT